MAPDRQVPAGAPTLEDLARRRRHRRESIERWVALGLVAVLALLMFVERGARQDADRVIECTIRGVLETSRDRAQDRGQLDPETAELYSRVLAPLEPNCPPLIVRVREAPAPTTSTPER